MHKIPYQFAYFTRNKKRGRFASHTSAVFVGMRRFCIFMTFIEFSLRQRVLNTERRIKRCCGKFTMGFLICIYCQFDWTLFNMYKIAYKPKSRYKVRRVFIFSINFAGVVKPHFFRRLFNIKRRQNFIEVFPYILYW